MLSVRTFARLSWIGIVLSAVMMSSTVRVIRGLGVIIWGVTVTQQFQLGVVYLLYKRKGINPDRFEQAARGLLQGTAPRTPPAAGAYAERAPGDNPPGVDDLFALAKEHS